MTEQSVAPEARSSESRSSESRISQIRLLVLAVAGVAAIGGAVLLGLRDGAVRPASAPAAPASTMPAAPEPAAGVAVKPSFDIVRINPQGDAVLAGHAPPGSEVRIEEAGHEIGRVQADRRGEWVFVPAEPLPPGAREFTLAARTPDGRESRSDGAVLLAIPDRSLQHAPVAVLSTPGTALRVLQSGAGSAPGLGLEAAEYDESGALRLAGRAPPDATVRVYLDDRPAGDARADARGSWTLSSRAAFAPGDHRVRLDQIGPDGHVIARALAPLPRDAVAERDLAPERVVVLPGQTLWRLARNAYGSGTRYTVLYEANRGQIQDPARIYPGQAFAVPALRGTR